MAWPLSQDYNEAIQSPSSNFADVDLRRGEAAANALGIPMPYSGNFADVYQVRCPGGRWAVKCFTREAPGLRERYHEISKHLRRAKLPFTVDFTYLEKGIRVAGQWYPVLKMQWVEGLTLNQFVGQSLDKPALLEALSQIWARMAHYLRAAQVGHCDLQHGNVLLVPGSGPNSLALKLIDYDGMWVPALAGKKSGELGHPSYQHPQRLRDGAYGLDVDRFPLLLVATSLRALKVKGRPLWDKYDNGDNLLFKEADLREPAQSALFRELPLLGDPLTGSLTAHLMKSLSAGLASAPLLEDVLPETRIAASRSPRPAAAAPPAEDRTFAFDEAAARPRARTKAGAVPVWAWAVGAAVLVVAVAGAAGAFVALRGHGADRTPVAQNPPDDPDAGAVQPVGDSTTPPKDPADGDTPPPASGEPDQWAGFHLGGAQRAKGFLRLAPHTVVSTRDSYAGPIEAAAVAQTEKNNIRLRAFNGASVIFNWEGNPGELRVTRPDGIEAPESGSLAAAPVRPLAPNAWHTLRWRVTENGAEVSVDGTVVFSETRKYDLSAAGPVALASVDSILQVKSFEVKSLDADAGERIGELRRFVGHEGGVRRLAVSPDGKQLLTAGGDKTIRLWDAATGDELSKWSSPAGPTFGLAFLPDGLRALSGGDDKFVHLWDVKSGNEIRSYAGHDLPVHQVSVSRDGRFALSCGPEDTLFLWDIEAGKERRRLEGNTGGASSTAFSADGRLAAVGTNQGPIRVWDLEKGRELPMLEGHAGAVMGAAFSPDGSLLASAGADRTVRLWRVEDGREMMRLEGNAGDVNGVAYSPDGRRVLTAGADGTLRLWDAKDGKELFRFAGDKTYLWDAAFSPDGRLAFSCGMGSAVRMWRLPPEGYVPPAPARPAEAARPARAPVPDDAALAEAEKKVKEAYKTDVKHKPAEMQALADRLIQDGLDTKNDPALSYAVFREARDQAAKAGDLDRCLRAAAEIAGRFAVGPREAKAAALEAAGRVAPNAAARLSVAEFALAAEDDALEADDYETAVRLVRAAGSPANKFIEIAAQGRRGEAEVLREVYEPLKASAQTLEEKPDDADASLALGRFYCLDKGDWDRGLPLLAQGGDAKLKELARRDLAGAADGDALAALGDAYKAAAEPESGPTRTHLLGRAWSWYQAAAGKLTGAPAAEAKAKAGEVDKLLPPQRPVVLYAMWGADDGWLDVTDRVRGLLARSKDQKATFKPGDVGIPSDPAPGRPKALVVVYRYRGWVLLSTTGENEAAALPAPFGPLDAPPGVPGPGQGLTVLHARFGADAGWEDKTANAQERVLGGTLTATPGQLGFGDPAFGKRKAMVLVYRYRGRVLLSVTSQGGSASIGAPARKP